MPRTKRSRLNPEERRKQLLEAAIDLFAERGIGEAKHADVAKRVGVSTAATFVYFPTRDALLDAVAEEICHFALALFDGVKPEKGGAKVILRQLAGGLLHAEASHPSYVRVLLGLSTRFDERLRRYYKEMQEQLLQKISDILWAHEGLTRKDDRDDARIILSAAQTLALMKIDGEPEEKLTRFTDHTIDVVLAFNEAVSKVRIRPL